MLAPSHYRTVGVSKSGKLVLSIRVFLGMSVLPECSVW
jgi:hypothetical protein